MKQDIQWSRLALEAVVIVGSILLAFSIDAVWEERQIRNDEINLLRVISDDVSSSIATVNDTISGIEVQQIRFSEFVNASDQTLANVSGTLFRQITNGIQRPMSSNLSQGVTAGLLNSGRIEIISNPRVRSSLQEWSVSIEELNERAFILAGLEVDAIKALNKHEVRQRFQLLPRSAQTEGYYDIMPLRSDADLMSIGYSMHTEREIYSIILGNSLDTLENLNELLASELNQLQNN